MSRAGWLLEATVLATLMVQAGLVLGVGVSLVPRWAGGPDLGEVPAPPPMPPVAHPATAPMDPVLARAESCGRLRDLFLSLDGQLSRESLGSPVAEAEVIRLVADGPCTLDDPAVRAILDRYRAAFSAAGLTPPPLLPQVER